MMIINKLIAPAEGACNMSCVSVVYFNVELTTRKMLQTLLSTYEGQESLQSIAGSYFNVELANQESLRTIVLLYFNVASSLQTTLTRNPETI